MKYASKIQMISTNRLPYPRYNHLDNINIYIIEAYGYATIQYVKFGYQISLTISSALLVEKSDSI